MPSSSSTRPTFLSRLRARGDVEAIRVFEELTFGELDRAWRGRAPLGADLDDTKQVLRSRLYVGGDDKLPKILGYAGRGTLRGWMRAVVARETINAFSRARPEVPSDDALFAALQWRERGRRDCSSRPKGR